MFALERFLRMQHFIQEVAPILNKIVDVLLKRREEKSSNQQKSPKKQPIGNQGQNRRSQDDHRITYMI